MKKRQFKKNLPNLTNYELSRLLKTHKKGYKWSYSYGELVKRWHDIADDEWCYFL